MTIEYFILSNRSVISISGTDKKNFLQGIISNDTNKISLASFLYALLLTPQGKLISDFFIIEKDNTYLLDCPKPLLEQIIKKLKMYKLRTDAEIKDRTHEYKVYASFAKVNDSFYPDPRDTRLGYRAIIETTANISGIEKDPNLLELKRIELLIPDMVIDLKPESFFPLELHLNTINAIDFNKGCYVGQEVTTRTHHRGVIRKKIYQAEIITGTPPLPGIDIIFNNKKIGETLGFVSNKGLCLMRSEEVESVREISLKVLDAEIKIIT